MFPLDDYLPPDDRSPYDGPLLPVDGDVDVEAVWVAQEAEWYLLAVACGDDPYARTEKPESIAPIGRIIVRPDEDTEE
jgi:hypothetical protein